MPLHIFHLVRYAFSTSASLTRVLTNKLKKQGKQKKARETKEAREKERFSTLSPGLVLISLIRTHISYRYLIEVKPKQHVDSLECGKLFCVSVCVCARTCVCMWGTRLQQGRRQRREKGARNRFSLNFSPWDRSPWLREHFQLNVGQHTEEWERCT